MKITQAIRIRAIATEGSNVGTYRQDLYRNAFKRIKQATDQGFNLEAITLIESLISDRLESRLSFLLKEDFSFKTLGVLINKAKRIENNEELKLVITSDLNKWRNQRNSALHEMIKIQEGETPSWEDRISNLKNVSESGLKLLRKIDLLCRKSP
jgi:biopolymer transport protein ExbB/TolQ